MKQSVVCRRAAALALAWSLLLLGGCQQGSDTPPPPQSSSPSSLESSAADSQSSSSSISSAPGSEASSQSQVTIEESLPPTLSTPAAPTPLRDSTPVVRTPVASGVTVLGNSLVEIDASNTSQGYVMVRYLGSNSNVKLQLTVDGGTTYTYNLDTGGAYETFPLAAGSGGYTLNVYENVSGNQYSLACGETFTASLASSLLPFLYPNQYVNYWPGCDTVAKGAELASTAASDLEVVEKVYTWVIGSISYDFDKAATVRSGYLPNVDGILASGKGICFDYAAVMATMLRTQRIPTKLVVGYAGSIYHAWISVYITDVGWVNGIIYFDGKSWVRMDPTFASSGNSSADIMQYIGNGSNYNPMLVY